LRKRMKMLLSKKKKRKKKKKKTHSIFQFKYNFVPFLMCHFNAPSVLKRTSLTQWITKHKTCKLHFFILTFFLEQWTLEMQLHVRIYYSNNCKAK
jgi:hypothetical protein